MNSPTTISLSNTMKVCSAKPTSNFSWCHKQIHTCMYNQNWTNPTENFRKPIYKTLIIHQKIESVHREIKYDTHTQRGRERTVRVLGPGELHLELLLKGEGLRGSGLKESRVLHPLMVLWYVCLHVRYHYHLLSLQTHSLFLHFFSCYLTLPHTDCSLCLTLCLPHRLIWTPIFTLLPSRYCFVLSKRLPFQNDATLLTLSFHFSFLNTGVSELTTLSYRLVMLFRSHCLIVVKIHDSEKIL